jgi:hypothetical protein
VLKGEEGWSLAERMRHYRVEAVSVALVRDYGVAWEAAAGLADREEGRKVTLERILSHGAGLTVHGFPGYAAGEGVPTVPQVLDGAFPPTLHPCGSTSFPGRAGATRAAATRSPRSRCRTRWAGRSRI